MRMRVGLVGSAVAAAVAAAAFTVVDPIERAPAQSAADARPTATRAMPPGPPLAFEPNVGQVAAHIAYIARGAQQTVELRPTGATMTIGSTPEADKSRVNLDLVGADPTARMTTADRRTGAADDLTAYGRVTAEQALPGIDLTWHGTPGGLGCALRIVPGAEVDEIRMAVSGAERLSLEPSGALLMHIAGGILIRAVPVAYQEVDGRRHALASEYVLEGHRFGFTVGDHDPTRPIVIDPVLSYVS